MTRTPSTTADDDADSGTGEAWVAGVLVLVLLAGLVTAVRCRQKKTPAGIGSAAVVLEQEQMPPCPPNQPPLVLDVNIAGSAAPVIALQPHQGRTDDSLVEQASAQGHELDALRAEVARLAAANSTNTQPAPPKWAPPQGNGTATSTSFPSILHAFISSVAPPRGP